jgi:hypothetical protein
MTVTAIATGRVPWTPREVEFVNAWCDANKPMNGSRWDWKACVRAAIAAKTLNPSHCHPVKVKDAWRTAHGDRDEARTASGLNATAGHGAHAV